MLGGDECKVHLQKGSLWRSHGRNVEGLLWSSRPTWIVGVLGFHVATTRNMLQGVGTNWRCGRNVRQTE